MMKYIFYIVISWFFYCQSNSAIKYPNIAVLILARGGSKGIPLKNLQKINDITLVRRSINKLIPLLEKGNIQSIWVSTDHPLIANEATNAGAQVFWRIPQHATDSATSISAMQEFINYHSEIDYLMLVQCTSPFLKTSYVLKAISILVSSNNKVQCVFSVTRSFKLRWKENGSKVTSENFNPENRPRRQNWQGELEENGMFYLSSRNLIEQGLLQDDSCSVVEIPAKYSLEIDSVWDLELAQNIAKTFDSELD